MSNYVVIGEDEFASRIAQELGTSFIQVSPTIFPDTELKIRLSAEALKTIRTKTPLVVMRAKRYHPNPNDCVLKTLLIADTLTRYGCKTRICCSRTCFMLDRTVNDYPENRIV